MDHYDRHCKARLSVRATRIGIDFTAFLTGVLLGGSYGYGTIFMVIVVGPIVQFSLNRYDKGAIFFFIDIFVFKLISPFSFLINFFKIN